MTDEFITNGLSDEQVLKARATFGWNELQHQHTNSFLISLKGVVREPMFLLLLAAAVIYFISGELGDGLFMLAAIVLVASISLYQESRSRSALQALRNLTQPKAKVIRNGTTIIIAREEIVPGDVMIVEEGSSVPADATILRAHDFSVNEAILTGESLPVAKSESTDDVRVYQGTTVVSGLAICNVTATGNATTLGKIGKSLENVEEGETPLQLQVASFVRKMAFLGITIFLILWGVNFYHSHNLPESLLKALTLAMSVVPEEIPVAFTTFMALGAWRLMKMGVVVKQTKTVETLGSATVICTDKTGTITENRMALAQVYVHNSNSIVSADDLHSKEELALLALAMWSSEPIPFDPMEIALHEAYEKLHTVDHRQSYKLIHEYPLEGTPPMMTHIFESKDGDRIIAAKGAPEALLKVCRLSVDERKRIEDALNKFSKQGLRVLGVGYSELDHQRYPRSQHQLQFKFAGLVAFYDPPKKNIKEVLQAFYNAGIEVKILTGDNATTTATIAEQIQFKGADKTMNGDALVNLTESALREQVKEVNIFTRMFPEAKLKILNALKANGHVVAMTGDGVNDGPALKAAHIGIAMGKKGSEIAKEASSLILSDDDLARMVDAIAMGRKIYSNLKKAIQYIISIHIPIILTVFLPLILGWTYPAIFSPVHIIFLELIMGPTCSIIYENEPLEKNAMLQKPRPFTTTFFQWNEVSTSILQGIVITVGVLFVYQVAVMGGSSEPVTRTMVFVTIVTANIFLTLVNRSFYYSVITTLRYHNLLLPLMIGATLLMMVGLLTISPLTAFFEFQMISGRQMLLSVGIGFLSVIWFEAVKFCKRVAKND